MVETYWTMEGLSHTNPNVAFEFQSVLRKVANERTIEKYEAQKEKERLENEMKIKKQAERAAHREKVVAEVGKKKMRRFEKPPHQKYVEKAKKAKGNRDMVIYMGDDIDMNEIAEQAKIAIVETKKKEEERARMKALYDAKMKELEGESDEY